MLQFSDINVSQGSIMTHLKCGGIINNHFTTNSLTCISVTAMSSVSPFLEHGVVCSFYLLMKKSDECSEVSTEK